MAGPRAYAKVSYSAGPHERQVSGQGIGSGKTRSRTHRRLSETAKRTLRMRRRS